MISDTKKFFLDILIKQFFLAARFFLLQEKKILAARKKCLATIKKKQQKNLALKNISAGTNSRFWTQNKVSHSAFSVERPLKNFALRYFMTNAEHIRHTNPLSKISR